MPLPPPTAHTASIQAAGAKFTKGFPASMQPGRPMPMHSKGAPITASFAQQFAAHTQQPPPTAIARTPMSARTLAPPGTSFYNPHNRPPASANSHYGAPPALSAGSPAPPQPPRSVQKQVLRAGEGAAAGEGDQVSVAYVGWLAGKDPSVERFDEGQDFGFVLGRGEVIVGWDYGVRGMREGEVCRLSIPSALAYGAKGAPPAIPPHADLMFEVLLKAVIPGRDASGGGGLAPALAQGEANGGADAAFVPASHFAGARAGYVFKSGERGVGYYQEAPAARADASPPEHAPANDESAEFNKSVTFSPESTMTHPPNMHFRWKKQQAEAQLAQRKAMRAALEQRGDGVLRYM